VEPGANGLRLDLVSPDEDEKLYRAVAAVQQAGHSEAVVYRALLEAVAFGERRLVQRARENGADSQRFIATGGGARNNAFMQVLASVLDVSIEVGEPDGGLVGAGMAAAIGAGWYASVDEAVAGMCASGPIIRPDPAGVEYYRGRHQEKE
jgi:xylulokinase